MDIEIRPIEASEFGTFARTIERAFGQYLRSDELEAERRVFEADRSLAAMEGGAIVGTAGAFSLELSIPGAIVPMAGVTAVGVSPSHRRRGILTLLMRRQLDDIRDRGEALAGLWASESSIYGRFGYGPSVLDATLEVERHRSAFAAPHRPSGSVEVIEREQALRQMPPIHDRVVAARPGMYRRTERWWEHDFADLEPWRDGASELFFAVHRSEEGSDGYVAYRTKRKWESGFPDGTLTVHELMASTSGAYADLWRYCFDVDLMERVEAWGRAVDEPLLFLLAEPRRLRTRLHDSLWLRLVDIEGALAARRYLQHSRVVLEVTDAFCPTNDGRYELEGGPDGATCRRTTAEADLGLTTNALAAAYLGGHRLFTMSEAGLVHGTADAIRRADAMFAWHRAPWCPQVF
jgi:predicted acetyltransferase